MASNPISRYVNGKIDERVYSVLKEMNLDIDTGTSILYDEKYYEMMNKVYYTCDTPEILRFFKTKRPKHMVYQTNNFYRVVQGNIPIQHFPLANVISKTMANLLFSDRPRIEVLSGSDDTNKLISDMYKENRFSVLLQKAVEYESYSGCVAFKPIIDKTFSDYPILMVYPKEDIEIVRKYDIVTDIIFKDVYTKGENNKYVLYSIYGKGYIDYHLYKNSQKKDLDEVPLSTLPETKDLHRVEFFTKDGPFKGLMAVYKENKSGAESDYKNLYDDFAALDEIYSNMIDFVRKSKIKTYYPESLLQQDILTGKKVQKNAYDSDEIILYDSYPAYTNVEVQRDVVDINNTMTGYREAFNNTLLNALTTAGLSPASIGLDMAGANSSALALNIRERTSLRTRSEKSKRWIDTLIELTELMWALYHAQGTDSRVFIQELEDELKVSMPDYEVPSFDEQVQSLGAALQNHLIDLDSALKILYPDKVDEEIDAMRMDIDNMLPDAQTIEDRELDKEDEE